MIQPQLFSCLICLKNQDDCVGSELHCIFGLRALARLHRVHLIIAGILLIINSACGNVRGNVCGAKKNDQYHDIDHQPLKKEEEKKKGLSYF